MVRFGLLPATQDQCESTEAEKGGGGWLWNGVDQDAVYRTVASRRLGYREYDLAGVVRADAEERVERAVQAGVSPRQCGRAVGHIPCHRVSVLDGIKTRTPTMVDRVDVVGQRGVEPGDGNRAVVEPEIGRHGINKLSGGAATVRAQADPVVFARVVEATARNLDADTVDRDAVKPVDRVVSRVCRGKVEPVIARVVGQGRTGSQPDFRANGNWSGLRVDGERAKHQQDCGEFVVCFIHDERCSGYRGFSRTAAQKQHTSRQAA